MIRSFIPPINTHMFLVQAAYSQPWLIQPISIFSIYGMSLVIMLTNYALAGFAMAWIDRQWHWFETPVMELQRSTRTLAYVGAALIIWCAIGLSTLASAPKDLPIIRVAAIQSGFMKPAHMDPTTQDARLQVLSEQTRAAAAQGAKLMVWPELGLGFDPQAAHTAELKDLAAETGAYILIGYGIKDDPRGWRNEMVMLTPTGEFLQVYGKNNPSSPGEPPIATAGVYPVYTTPYGKVGTIICNDINFTGTVRKIVSNGAQLVAFPTWEVSMPGFHWELPIQGVLRGVENRAAIVKADTAFSAMIVDPYGRILAERDGAPNGEAFALVADVPLGTGKTLNNKYGDWVGWVSLIGLIIFTVFQSRVSRKGKKT
jgi:apolipoprotein N-acyltransferase